MRWFQGGIAEAVAASKSRNAVFVVFVEGKDEASRNAAATVDDAAISNKLESADFVAIKLDSESEAYRQFTQIYQLVPIPSLFFIGGNGVPLEVVAGEVNVPELLRRINLVLEKSGKSVAQGNETSATEKHENKQESTKTSNEEARSSEDAAASSSTAETENVAPTVETGSSESADGSQILTTEEKMERAKELIEKKRKIKQEEEEQSQKQKEVERRKMGQEVQKLRRWQQDQELKQLKEERQREKAEEAAARERILQQIAQDKAERASRFAVAQGAAKKQEDLKKQSEEQAREAATKCDVARIQFRLPDGSTHSHNFEASATLREVRTYAATQLNFPFREFAMSTTFPRREFTANDDGTTVRDLQLVPTAVILILPASSGTVVSSSSNNYGSALSNMVWSLLTPIFSLLNYLRNFLFGGGAGGGARGGNTGNSREKKTPQSSTTQSTGARRRTPASDGSAVHRQGNIHRLTNRHDSSDDENNTWNGNSTQQM